MILIFTNKQDPHADEVIKKLYTRNIEVFRLNSEDLLLNYKINLSIDESGLFSGEIIDDLGRILNLAKLRVAWLRKPMFDFFGDESAESEERKFIASETKAFINTLYSMPNIQWINDPFIANRAKVKLQQLLFAKKYDIKVPKTLITTQPEVAKEFFIECGEEVLQDLRKGHFPRREPKLVKQIAREKLRLDLINSLPSFIGNLFQSRPHQ